jgi:hypothetical protein
MASCHEGLGVAGAWRFTWDGLAARGAAAGLPGVLGPALSMPALHGAKAIQNTSDAHHSAGLRRGGLLPQAAVSPAPRRATRALLRRRRPLAPQRAAHLAHGQQTNRQSNLPALGTQRASTATRTGGAARFANPAVQRLGTAGATSDKAHLPWAVAAAAGLGLRAHPAAPPYGARVEHNHATGPAWPVRAQPWARAGSPRRQRQGAVAREHACPRAGRGAAKPGSALAPQGPHRPEAPDPACSMASLHATAPIGHEPRRPAPWLGPPRSLRWHPGLVAHGLRGRPRPRAGRSRDHADALSPSFA